MGKAAVSQEEILLRKRARRRLVGAAFLVLVMVIVLPLLLDSEPRPQAESVRVRMPTPQPEVIDPPTLAPSPRPGTAVPMPETGAPGSEANAPQPDAAPPKDAPAVIADLPPPDTEAPPAPKKETAAKPAPAEPAPPSVQTASVRTPSAATAPLREEKPAEVAADEVAAPKPPVVIQLGAYIKAENAQQLKAELAAKKIRAFTEAITMGQTTKTRVRAGPFDSLAEAEKVKERIARMNLKLGMAPKIVAQGQ